MYLHPASTSLQSGDKTNPSEVGYTLCCTKYGRVREVGAQAWSVQSHWAHSLKGHAKAAAMDIEGSLGTILPHILSKTDCDRTRGNRSWLFDYRDITSFLEQSCQDLCIYVDRPSPSSCGRDSPHLLPKSPRVTYSGRPRSGRIGP